MAIFVITYRRRTNMNVDEPYLLCLDNADDLSLIKNCFPCDNIGTIVIMSRDSVGTAELVRDSVIVLEFFIREGCDFLSSLLRDVDIFDSGNMVILENISTTFHGYLLALGQAVAFIWSGGCFLDEFLSVF